MQALRGMGGVGKTQLAIEYTHRYAPRYDVVWWIFAARPELIGGQFAALGTVLGCIQPGADHAAVRRAVLGELRGRERWLLVFDSAEQSGDITGWLPGGAGHVLITSRAGGWEEVAVSVEVDVLERSESIAMLRRRMPGLGEADAGLVAAAVGNLPLAVAQAASYMAPAGISAADYVRMVEGRAAAPEPIPAEWFTGAATRLSGPLRKATADPLVWGQVTTQISGQALARELGEYQAARELEEDTLARRRQILGEGHPDTLASASNLAADLRTLGEYGAALDLDKDSLARSRRVLGEDHPDTLISARSLAADLRALGEVSDGSGT